MISNTDATGYATDSVGCSCTTWTGCYHQRASLFQAKINALDAYLRMQEIERELEELFWQEVWNAGLFYLDFDGDESEDVGGVL